MFFGGRTVLRSRCWWRLGRCRHKQSNHPKGWLFFYIFLLLQNISNLKAYRVACDISNALAYIDYLYVYLTINSIYCYAIRYIFSSLKLDMFCFTKQVFGTVFYQKTTTIERQKYVCSMVVTIIFKFIVTV